MVEVDNVRTALDFGFGIHGEAGAAVGLAASSGPLWPILSLFGEGVQRLEGAVSRLASDTSKVDAAELWLRLGLVWADAAPAKALTPYEQAVRYYRELGNERALADALVRLSRVLGVMGRLEDSASHLAEAFPIVLRSGLPKLSLLYYHNAGYHKMLRRAGIPDWTECRFRANQRTGKQAARLIHSARNLPVDSSGARASVACVLSVSWKIANHVFDPPATVCASAVTISEYGSGV